MQEAPQPFIIGWEEWVALPELGLPAIKAKVDTGARTSALHAFLVEPFGSASSPMVRFGVHPVPGRDDIEVYRTAEVVDRREVTSSNGEKETRVFIRTPLSIGERVWDIEIGLTNREGMSYRMLLGRQAIRTDVMVDPSGSFRQPRLSYRLYRHWPQKMRRPRLRLALVGRSERTASARLLSNAVAAAGHELQLIDLARVELVFDPAAPGMTLDKAALPAFDAVIPRVGLSDGRFGAAAVRQLELMGALAVNPGDALDRRANPLALRQALSAAGIAFEPGKPEPKVMRRGGTQEAPVRVLVVGGRAVAAIRRQGTKRTVGGISSGLGLADHPTECGIGESTAAALRLGLVAVDVDASGARPCARAITARPALSKWGQAAGVAAAEAIVNLLESAVRSGNRRALPLGPPVAAEPE